MLKMSCELVSGKKNLPDNILGRFFMQAEFEL